MFWLTFCLNENQIDFRMIRVFDRFQSQSIEVNGENSILDGKEKTAVDKKEIGVQFGTREIISGDMDNKCINELDQLDGSVGVATEEVFSRDALENVSQSADDEEEISAANAHRSPIEATIETKNEAIDCRRCMSCRADLSSLNELSPLPTASTDSTNALKNIMVLETNNNYLPMASADTVTANTDAINALKESCSENGKTVPFSEVLGAGDPDAPMPDLLMNLDPATKSQDDTSPLKRENSIESADGSAAKRSKHDDNKGEIRRIF